MWQFGQNSSEKLRRITKNSLEKLRWVFEKSLEKVYRWSPCPINAFLVTNNMNAVSEEYKGILKEYRDDMVKYAPDKDKPNIRDGRQCQR